MNEMEYALHARLQDLEPQAFVFTDESHLHIGHAGNRGGGHYRLLLVSERFTGVSRIGRQRMVQARLADLFEGGHIHALSLTARTPSEQLIIDNKENL